MPVSFPGFARCTALIVGLTSPFAVQAKADDRTILVTGEGEASVAPDQVEFVIGIDVTEAKVEASKAKSDEAMRRILATAKEFKIEARDVQSDYIRIQPIQENLYPNSAKPGPLVYRYNARRDVRILLRDISKYDGLMAALFEGGANNLHSLQFKTSNPNKLEVDARSLALKDAKSKAEMIAQQMSLKLGRPRSIAEGLREPTPVPMMTMAFKESFARDSREPTLSPGEIKVREQVTVIFEAE